MKDVERAAQLVDAGVWMRLSGDLDGARKLFERALKLDPANVKAREFLELAESASPLAEPGRKLGALLDEALAQGEAGPPAIRGDAHAGGAAAPASAGAAAASSAGGAGSPVPEHGGPPSKAARLLSGLGVGAALAVPPSFTPSALVRDYARNGPGRPSGGGEPTTSASSEAPRGSGQSAPEAASSPSALLRGYGGPGPGVDAAQRGGRALENARAEHVAPAPTGAGGGGAVVSAAAQAGTAAREPDELELPRMVVTATGTPSYGPPRASDPAGGAGGRAAVALAARPPEVRGLVGADRRDGLSEPRAAPGPEASRPLGLSGIVRIDGRPDGVADPSRPAPSRVTAVPDTPVEPEPPTAPATPLFRGFTLSPLPRPLPGEEAPLPEPPMPSVDADRGSGGDEPAWTWRRGPVGAPPGAPRPSGASGPDVGGQPPPLGPPGSGLVPPQASPVGGSAWERTAGPPATGGGPPVAPVAFDFLASPPGPSSSSSSGRRRRADEVRLLVDDAMRRLALDDHSGTIELLDKALALDPKNEELAALRARSQRTLTTMYESKIGKMSAKPRVLLKDDEVIWLNLDHRAGFVLAQIDGQVSFEDLFSVSGMTHFDTARILAQLIDEGVISNG